MPPAFRFGPFVYRPRWVTTLATLTMVALALTAAQWQQGRANQKRALQARYDAAERMPRQLMVGMEALEQVEYRHVRLLGAWVPDKAIWIDNRTYQGLAGYHLIMPLRFPGTDRYVLVNRGWVPRSANLAKAAAVPDGLVEVLGRAVPPPGRYVELSQQTVSGHIWQNLSIERYARRYAMSVMPVLVEQANGQSDGLIREWKKPDAGVHKHVAYAVQWYGIALAVVVLYVVLNVKRQSVS